jgi:hypothetical protein
MSNCRSRSSSLGAKRPFFFCFCFISIFSSLLSFYFFYSVVTILRVGVRDAS